MAIETVLLRGVSGLQEAVRLVDDALNGVGPHEQTALTFTDVPPDGILAENPDIAFTASDAGPGNGWAVRVYVWDRGHTCEVRLRALGDIWARTLWSGARGRPQLSRGRRVVTRVAQRLRALDTEQG